MELLETPLPTLDEPRVVVPAPGSGPGNWAGAASAVLVDGVTISMMFRALTTYRSLLPELFKIDNLARVARRRAESFVAR